MEGTQKARDAFWKRFLDEVDPARELPEAERHRRALSARKAYYARLQLAASRARSARKAARGWQPKGVSVRRIPKKT